MGVSVPYRGLMSRKLHDVYYGNDEEFNCFSPLSGFNVSQASQFGNYLALIIEKFQSPIVV